MLHYGHAQEHQLSCIDHNFIPTPFHQVQSPPFIFKNLVCQLLLILTNASPCLSQAAPQHPLCSFKPFPCNVLLLELTSAMRSTETQSFHKQSSAAMQIRSCHPGPIHVLLLNCVWLTIPSKTRAWCSYMLYSSLSVNANELLSNQDHKTRAWLQCSLPTVKMTLIVFPSNLVVKELLVPLLQLDVDPSSGSLRTQF